MVFPCYYTIYFFAKISNFISLSRSFQNLIIKIVPYKNNIIKNKHIPLVSSTTIPSKNYRLNQKITYILLLSLAFSMPIYTEITNVLLILLLLNCFWGGLKKNKFILSKHNYPFYFFLTLYSWHILGMLYTENVSDGLFDLQVKLPFLIIPFVFCFIDTLYQEDIWKILGAFIAGCLLASFVGLFFAVYQYYFFQESKFFFSQDLSSVIDFHAIYFSLYCFFSCLIIAFYFFGNYKRLSVIQQLILFFLLIYLTIFLLLLSSRIALLLLVVYYIWIFVYYIYLTKYYKTALLIFITGITTIILFISLYPNKLIQDRLSEFNNAFYFEPKTNKPVQQSRLDIWQYSIYNIGIYPIAGVGTGDTQTILDQSYYNTHRWFSEIHLNSHNQYLQFALALGIPCALFFIFAQVWLIRINSSNAHFLIFILTISAFMLTESLLVRQRGIIFFIFFFCLLYLKGLKKTNITKIEES